MARMYNRTFLEFLILEPSFVASFCRFAGANQSPRIFDLQPSQTLFEFWDPSNSNEQRHLCPFRIDHNGVPILRTILILRLQKYVLSKVYRCECHSTSILKGITSSEYLLTEFVWIFNCVAWVSLMLDDGSIFADPVSLSFATGLSNSDSVLVRLCLGSLRRDSATWRIFPPHITTQEFRFGVVVDGIQNFNSMSAKKLYHVNLYDWSNSSSSWDCSINSGIWNSPRECTPSANTIIYVCNGLLAHSSRDSFPEWRISANFCKSDFFLQCFEGLKTFSQSVSRCWILTPWSWLQRIYFLRFHIFQKLLISFCHQPFWCRLSLIRP